MNASKNLKEAADTIASSPAALQLRYESYHTIHMSHFIWVMIKYLYLRYLQTLTAISAEKNSTIVFPIPMDMNPLRDVKK